MWQTVGTVSICLNYQSTPSCKIYTTLHNLSLNIIVETVPTVNNSFLGLFYSSVFPRGCNLNLIIAPVFFRRETKYKDWNKNIYFTLDHTKLLRVLLLTRHCFLWMEGNLKLRLQLQLLFFWNNSLFCNLINVFAKSKFTSKWNGLKALAVCMLVVFSIYKTK